MSLSVLRQAALAAALLAGTFMLPAQVTAEDAGSDAWHFDVVEKLLTARIDPIVNPGAVAQHAHLVFGGSNFAAGYSYENSRASDCSTVYNNHDMSNYWTPQLYWVNNDANEVNAETTYTPLDAAHRFYYFLTRNQPDIPVSPFPKGLRILAGKNTAKTYNDTGIPTDGLTYQCQISSTDLDSNPIAATWNDFDFYCQQVKLELKFPSCWDGVNLYSEDGSHMAYPQALMYGSCPMSHPTRLPAILLEVTWHLQDIPTTDSPKNRLILANGDTTGFGTHADFSNGWDTDVLHAALNDPVCVGLGHSIPAADCPSLNFNADTGAAAAKVCQPMRGQLVENGTTDGVPASRLPGCNKPWPSGAKPTCDDEVIYTPDLTKFLGVTTQPYPATADDTVDVWLATPLSNTSTVWQDVGCITNDGFDDDVVEWQDWHQMTIGNCQDFCGSIGYPYAALALGYQCFCSKQLNLSAAKVDPARCDIACSGDSSTTCGYDGLMHTYYKPTVAAVRPSTTDLSYAGCYQDVTISDMKDPDITDLTGCKEYCSSKGTKYFGVSNAQYCVCGDMPADGAGRRVPEFECNSKCSFNSSQICGGNEQGTFYQSVYLVAGEFVVASSNTSSTSVASSTVATTSTTAISSTATANATQTSAGSSTVVSQTTAANSSVVTGQSTASASTAAATMAVNSTINLTTSNSSNINTTVLSTSSVNSTSTLLTNSTVSANGTTLSQVNATATITQAVGITSSSIAPTATSKKVCSRKRRRRDLPVRIVQRHQRRSARRSLTL